MARETKAERVAREEREHQEYLEKKKAEYFPRLMAVLERATKHGGLIVVREGKFVLNFQLEDHCLSPFYNAAETYVWNDTLECVEAEVDSYEAMLAEMERKRLLRSAALAKLSAEEAEALGVSKF